MKPETHLPNGTIIEVDDGHSFWFGCCNCPFVHFINVRKIAKNKIRLTVFRDDLQTSLRKKTASKKRKKK